MTKYIVSICEAMMDLMIRVFSCGHLDLESWRNALNLSQDK